MPRATSALALVACLHLAPTTVRAQAPDASPEPWASPAPCALAPPDATAEELARRLHLCSRIAALYAARLAVLERAMAGLDTAARVLPPAGEVSRATTPEKP